MGVRRKPSLKVIERNESILEKIRALKADHPFWGYRRIWAHLTYVSGLEINKKRVYRLMKLHNLTVYPKKLEISLYSRLQTKELRLSSAVIHPIGFAVK